MTALAPPGPRAALTAFDRICDRWMLTADQRSALLGRSARTSRRYGVTPSRLGADVQERIELLVGIYHDLRQVFGRGPAADEWVKRPNRHFGGRPPLDRMLTGKITDLAWVRRYLAIARQGLPV
jgi:uncharacterized protein (DUF2384 family)